MTATVAPPVEAAPKVRRKKSGAAEGGAGRAGWFVKGSIILICFLWIVPAIGIIVTSFRPTEDINDSGWWQVFIHPAKYLTDLTTQNYSDAIHQANIGQGLLNSAAIALPATFIPILIAAFAAYAFTFMRFPGRDVLFIIIVSMLVVPNYVAFVPILKLYSTLHLAGHFPAAWLAHIGFGMSLAIFILRNYMATLPKEVIESAKVDGASHFTTFWRLILPMSVPALAAFAIFQFLWTWNDLLVALVFIGPGDNQPVTIAVANLLGQQGAGWQLVTAGGMLSMIIPIIVFMSMQRFFIRGLTAGSVKG
ncbi:MAG TPA: carbohydrate ABC transporter permease [Actinomycetes bacterium]|nr:carbohydrate ABC transporter permease [Actinomycetes bacterium]